MKNKKRVIIYITSTILILSIALMLVELPTSKKKDYQLNIDIESNDNITNPINYSEVTNKVESRLIYGNNEITDEDKVTDKVPYGVVIATYKDTDGNELTTEVRTTDLVGKEYNTEEKDFFGYSLKEINGNENGTYIDDTIYVEYIYTNTMGTGDIEELPPQTGVEQNNLYNYLIIISMLVLSVRGYKKVKETL